MKKYYKIKEVAEILNTSKHKLRYIEKIIAKIKISRINGIRHYTKQDIDNLKIYLVNDSISEDKSKNIETNILGRINRLIEDFNSVAKKLKIHL